MENKKYYTPEISELFIGYECEALSDDFVFGFDWRPYRVSDLNEKLSQQFLKLLRTPYLSKEDIIDLGWEHKQYVKDSKLVYNFVKEDWYLEFWVGQIPYIEIGRENYDTGFAGNCKSKNELLKLMKDYLNIN